MTESYHDGTPAVNPSALPYPILKTYRLLADLWRRHGYAWAHNAWLANRLEVSERTITRHITALVEAGLILTRRVGNERHIAPAVEPPMATRCLPVHEERTRKSHNNTPPTSDAAVAEPETSKEVVLVEQIEALGVAPATAKQLVKEDAEECQRQLDALPHRKGVIEKAAVYIASVRRKFSMPKIPQIVRRQPAQPLVRPPQPDIKTDAIRRQVIEDTRRRLRHALPLSATVTE